MSQSRLYHLLFAGLFAVAIFLNFFWLSQDPGKVIYWLAGAVSVLCFAGHWRDLVSPSPSK